jgi:hypothetical protein
LTSFLKEIKNLNFEKKFLEEIKKFKCRKKKFLQKNKKAQVPVKNQNFETNQAEVLQKKIKICKPAQAKKKNNDTYLTLRSTISCKNNNTFLNLRSTSLSKK